MRRAIGLIVVFVGSGVAIGQQSVEDACGSALLRQAPVSQRLGFPSNTNFALVAAADNFVLTEDAELSRVIFWGFYENAPTGPPVGERFALVIRADAGGTPGAIAAPPLFTLTPERTAFPLGAETIFRFVADLPPIELTSGAYWVSVVSDGTVGSGGDPPPDEPSFTWQHGQLDKVNGGPGAASFSNAQPIWQPLEGEFAVWLCGPVQTPAIPTLDPWGGLVLAGVMAVVAWPMLKRVQFREQKIKRGNECLTCTQVARAFASFMGRSHGYSFSSPLPACGYSATSREPCRRHRRYRTSLCRRLDPRRAAPCLARTCSSAD